MGDTSAPHSLPPQNGPKSQLFLLLWAASPLRRPISRPGMSCSRCKPLAQTLPPQGLPLPPFMVSGPQLICCWFIELPGLTPHRPRQSFWGCGKAGLPSAWGACRRSGPRIPGRTWQRCPEAGEPGATRTGVRTGVCVCRKWTRVSCLFVCLW